MEIDERRVDRIDLREAVMDFATQEIITRDNVAIKVHPMILYRIVDPVRAVYEVYDLPLAVEKLVQTTVSSRKKGESECAKITATHITFFNSNPAPLYYW